MSECTYTPPTAEHTPGPWSAEEWTSRARTTVLAPIEGVAGGIVIADCGPSRSGYCDSETEANARLIAAAPDMLEALKEFVAYSECHCAEPECPPCAYCMAEQAIEKAEGVHA